MVLGHRADEIAAHLAGEGVRVVENPDYAAGMLTSLQAGVRAAPPEASWYLIALGDQPAVAPETVRRLLESAAGEAGPAFVIPTFLGRGGHPVLVHAAFRDELLTLPPEEGLRGLMLRHPDARREVEVGTDEVLRDLDTPEDYRRELRLREDAGKGERPEAPNR